MSFQPNEENGPPIVTRRLGLLALGFALAAGAAAVAAVAVGYGGLRSRAAPLPVIEAAPAFTLVDQEGRTVRLDDLRGRIKVLTFFYSACSMPDQCPRTTQQLRAAGEMLGAARANDALFLMVSFDPERDTPGMLAKYAELYGATGANWHFLTGDRGAIDAVCADYQIIQERQEDGTIRHSMLTFLIDAENRIRRLYLANRWNPDDLVADIGRLREELK